MMETEAIVRNRRLSVPEQTSKIFEPMKTSFRLQMEFERNCEMLLTDDLTVDQVAKIN